MGPSEYFILVIFIALGLFSLTAAILNIDWYFKTSGAATFIKLFGRQGKQIFYRLVGLALNACGVCGLLYW